MPHVNGLHLALGVYLAGVVLALLYSERPIKMPAVALASLKPLELFYNEVIVFTWNELFVPVVNVILAAPVAILSALSKQ